MAKEKALDLRGVLDEIAPFGPSSADGDVTAVMEVMPPFFRATVIGAGHTKPSVDKVVTKFRDAGRRTPPTKQFSSVGPGRPQNAADGNRTLRWLLPSGHKYFATKRDAELVEIRYYLQALSLDDAPRIEDSQIRNAFWWLLNHEVAPGEYRDPILLRPISFKEFLRNPGTMTSGHFIPLNRGGRHEPSNTFLMLARSNTMQNDLTFDEFLAVIADIQLRQAAIGNVADPSKMPTDQFLEGIVSVETVFDS